jgi:hypothetical protein
VSTERIPRGTHTHLARRGEIATKTQELRPALFCEPLPNHVLPLAHFGAAISDVCGGVTGSGLDLEPEIEVTKLRMARRT